MKRIVLAMVLAGLTLTGCATAANTLESQRNAAASAVASLEGSASASAAAWWPEGYDEALPGLAARWAADGVKVDCPSYAESCFGVEFIARDGCPSGVYVELALLNAAGDVVGKANEITAGLAPGDHAIAAVSTTQDVARAKMAKINCMG